MPTMAMLHRRSVKRCRGVFWLIAGIPVAKPVNSDRSLEFEQWPIRMTSISYAIRFAEKKSPERTIFDLWRFNGLQAGKNYRSTRRKGKQRQVVDWTRATSARVQSETSPRDYGVFS